MLNKFSFILLIVGICTLVNVSASEVSTLFTTPQERQLINANRYKSDEAKSPKRVIEEPSAVEEIRQVIMEEVRVPVTISGITLSDNGPNMVWINNQVYQDGDKIDGEMKIRVMPGSEVKVRITAPDGKQHYATSGETIEIIYQVAVES